MVATLPSDISIDDKGRPCQVDHFKGEDGLVDPGFTGAIGDGSSTPLRWSTGLQGQTTRARSPDGGGGGSTGGVAGASLVIVKNKCNSKGRQVDPDIDGDSLPHPCGCWMWVDGKGGQVYPFRCKRWRCPRCGRVNRYRLLKILGEQARLHGLQRLLTLTLPAEIGIDPQAEEYLLKVWAKWRVYLARRYGRQVVYLWVKERKNGRLHLHCLVDRYLPQAWISDSWAALGGGRVVDIRWVDLHRVQVYLTKYLTKDFYAGVDGRHYGSSQTVDLRLYPKVDGVHHFELVCLPCHHFVDSPGLDALRDWLLSRLVLQRQRSDGLPVDGLVYN